MTTRTRPEDLFADAVAAWHMDGPISTNGRYALETRGAVSIGQPLAGEELAESESRGGDGKVAAFRGGHLVAAPEPGLELTGKFMTLTMRLRDNTGSWSSPLFARDDQDDPHGLILRGREQRLEYLWRTTPLAERVIPGWLTPDRKVSPDLLNGLLHLGAPASLIGPAGWHDVIVRFRCAHVELFVDGVLLDKDWPHGELSLFKGPFLIGAGWLDGSLTSGFHGQIDHLALWNRALADEEIALFSGGEPEVARRDLQINGPESSSPQYWKPRGYNTSAGDCMPFFHDGTFRLFYLNDRHHHGGKWGQGGGGYGQWSSEDLKHWRQQPMALPVTEPWECAMGTGNCIWHDGIYHLFYTDCGWRCEYKDKPHRGGSISCATSTDGVHFAKNPARVMPGGDCDVFRNPETGLFHMVCGPQLWVSSDLRTWEKSDGGISNVKPGTSHECGTWFSWNGWYYFVLGGNATWKSRHPLGPWEEMPPTIYDGLFVPKVGEFTGNRRILAGFSCKHPDYWGGVLALRELTQLPDGGLGMKFPRELVPASGDPLPLTLSAMSPHASGHGKRVTIRTDTPFAAAALDGAVRSIRLTLRIIPRAGTKSFGLCFRGQGAYASGCELRFDPARQRAQYGFPTDRGPAKDEDSIAKTRDFALHHQGFAIEHVEGLDKPFTLEIIVKDDVIDTCIGGRRTLIVRHDSAPDSNRLFFFACEGEVTFDAVEARPIE